MTECIICREVREISWLLGFILKNHAHGIRVLTGEVAWPETEEIYTMLTGGRAAPDDRVDGGEKIPEQQRIVETLQRYAGALKIIGGIGPITTRFAALKKHNEETYEFLRDASNIMKRGVFKRYTGNAVADKYYMSRAQLFRNRDKLLLQLANEIVFPDD